MFSNEAINVLRRLSSERDDFVSYAVSICEDIGLEKPDFLAHCRELRNHGYVRLAVLFDEAECRPSGSAYARTGKGDVLLTLSLGPNWRNAA